MGRDGRQPLWRACRRCTLMHAPACGPAAPGRAPGGLRGEGGRRRGGWAAGTARAPRAVPPPGTSPTRHGSAWVHPPLTEGRRAGGGAHRHLAGPHEAGEEAGQQGRPVHQACGGLGIGGWGLGESQARTRRHQGRHSGAPALTRHVVPGPGARSASARAPSAAMRTRQCKQRCADSPLTSCLARRAKSEYQSESQKRQWSSCCATQKDARRGGGGRRAAVRARVRQVEWSSCCGGGSCQERKGERGREGPGAHRQHGQLRRTPRTPLAVQGSRPSMQEASPQTDGQQAARLPQVQPARRPGAPGAPPRQRLVRGQQQRQPAQGLRRAGARTTRSRCVAGVCAVAASQPASQPQDPAASPPRDTAPRDLAAAGAAHLEALGALRVGQRGREPRPDLGGGARREEAAAAVHQRGEGLVAGLRHAAACRQIERRGREDWI